MEDSTEFILQCKPNSFIEQVMYAKASLDISALLNQPLLFCLSPDSVENGKKFLDDIRLRGKAEGYNLGIVLREEPYHFIFSGVMLHNHIIIVAQHKSLSETNPVDTSELVTEELVTEELENALVATPEDEQEETETEVTVWDLMEELSRLNNELINSKRELIRKNIELERLKDQLNKG